VPQYFPQGCIPDGSCLPQTRHFIKRKHSGPRAGGLTREAFRSEPPARAGVCGLGDTAVAGRSRDRTLARARDRRWQLFSVAPVLCGEVGISPSTRSGEQGLHKMCHDRLDRVSIDLCWRNELIPSHEKTRPVLEFQDRSHPILVSLVATRLGPICDQAWFTFPSHSGHIQDWSRKIQDRSHPILPRLVKTGLVVPRPVFIPMCSKLSFRYATSRIVCPEYATHIGALWLQRRSW
jgi:hypothetical protein